MYDSVNHTTFYMQFYCLKSLLISMKICIVVLEVVIMFLTDSVMLLVVMTYEKLM